MKLLSKTAWRMITKAISRACPKFPQRSGGFNLEAMEGRTLLSVGLDPHFGVDGKALADLGGSDQGYAMAVQSDGKILMAGRACNAGQYDFGVVRFNTDGSLDTSFGNGGMVMTDLGSQFDAAYAMAVQSNGKIVVVGQTDDNGNYNFGMVRYNSNGSLDTTFGNGGTVVTDLAGSYDIAYGVVVHASGKITVAGTATDENYHFRFGLAQFNADGSLDSNFGSGGKVMTAFGDMDTEGYTIMKGGGGSIVVGGYAYDFDSGTTNVAMARYNSDGSLDTTFDSDGMVVSDLGMDDETIRAMTTDANGNIVVAGNGGGDFLIARYSANGHLDSSFANNGKLFVDFVGGYDVAHTVAMSGDKILVAGTADMIGDMNMGVVSLNSDGSVNSDLSNSGVLSVDLGSWDDEATGVVVENNGNMFLGGFMVNSSGDYDYVVAHYGTFADNSNVAPVADAGGPYSVSEGGAVQLSGAASHDPDGSIVSYEWDLDYDGSNFNVDATGMTAMVSATSLDGPTTRMVALRVTDDKGSNSMTSVVVNVTNANPVVDAGSDMTVNEGAHVDLGALVSDMGLSDTFSYLWHVSASNGQVIADGTGTQMSFVAADNGVYTVTVTVMDDDGGVGSDTMVVTALNVNPVANAGDDQTVNEGSMVTLGGSFSDPGNDSYSILWHVVASNGQEVADGHGVGFGFVAMDNGTYTVTYTVTDDDGGSGSDSMVVTVNNVAPTANAGDDQVVNEGSAVTLGGSFSDPGNDSYSILWHVVASNGQVVADGNGSLLGFTPVDNGTYTVTYTVTDDDGGVGSDVVMVTVNNVAPTANAGEDRSVDENTMVSLTGAHTDPGALDTMSCLWHVVASNGQSVTDGHGDHFSFTPVDNGTYTVSFTVTDKDGGSSTDTMLVTVNNVAPTVVGSADKTVNEGTMVSLSAVGSDVSPVDTLSYLWHVSASNGQVVADGSGTGFSFTPMDNGVYTVTVTVMDDDGGSSSDTVLVSVNNVAPRAAVAGEASAVRYQARAYTGGFVDPGAMDTQEVYWDFGDGTVINWHSSTDANAMNVTHAWANTGTYKVTMVVRDDDGGLTSAWQTVNIKVVDLQPDAADSSKLNLVVGGTSGNDVISFERPKMALGVQVMLNSQNLGLFNPTGKVIAFGGAGNDDISIAGGLDFNVEFWGGDGNDSLKGGKANDTLVGGAGVDKISGGGGVDVVWADDADIITNTTLASKKLLNAFIKSAVV